ncbi:S8 family serine peptidase [Myroides sp. mNGS23_01]|nr:S8 family serine peptidase [Myroides sp. mNGS23_01]WHT40046.1 S8 family serine peptidase [Myroides sp. mNGS23_01]
MTLRKPLLNLGTASQDDRLRFEGGRSHATHVSGTIAAKGLNAAAKGIAPAAKIISYDWDRDTQLCVKQQEQMHYWYRITRTDTQQSTMADVQYLQ